jgi:hypothetical protein
MSLYYCEVLVYYSAELLQIERLNALETRADIYGCPTGNKNSVMIELRIGSTLHYTAAKKAQS